MGRPAAGAGMPDMALWKELARLAGLGPAADRVGEAASELEAVLQSMQVVGGYPVADDTEPATAFAPGWAAVGAGPADHPQTRQAPEQPTEPARPGGRARDVPAHRLGVLEAARLIRRGELSPVELVEDCLQRIEAAEPTVRAWVRVLRDEALQQARQAEAALRARGPLGPLHGVPFAAKDIFHVRGVPTAAGTSSWQVVPAEDAAAVARLKRAGAIFLGKTATTEFAFRDPAPTRNPWNPEHTPGGSSSGSAAAVAARMVPLALGSQTAGSLSRPAAYCGVVTLKATYGRISRRGVIPLSWSLDHVGAFTVTVADQLPVLAALCGPDPEDPTTLGAPPWTDGLEGRPEPAGTPGLVGRFEDAGWAAQRVRGRVVGVPDRFFGDGVHPGTQQLFEEALRVLEGLGMRVEKVALPPSFEAAQAAHYLIMRVEAATYHLARLRENPDSVRPGLRHMVIAGALVPAVVYERAQQLRRLYVREMQELLERVDLLATPATPGPAPRGLEWTGPYQFNAPFTLAGFPTLTLPMGRVEGNLPVGLQLVAPPYGEVRLLEAGLAYQAVTEWHRHLPPV